MAQQQSTFYMVWNPTGGPPRVQHSDFNTANNEAKRLARANPGKDFVVLEAVRAYRLAEFVETQFVQELPF